MIQMKLILITLAFLITFISAHHNTEGYYPLETVCSSNTTCASNSFCDLSEGLCVCNYGWATKDGSTCSFKLRCQQTLLLAHGANINDSDWPHINAEKFPLFNNHYYHYIIEIFFSKEERSLPEPLP